MKLSQERSFQFLEKVSAAAIANPFSHERDSIDAEIVSQWMPERPSKAADAELIASFARDVLSHFFSQASAQGSLSPAQKKILEDSALFAVFHKYMDQFDDFIRKQNATAGVSLELPFASQVESDLASYGFKKQAAHYIAVFFQMRRAFFFISQFVGGASEPVRILRERLWRTLFTSDLRQFISTLFDKMESYSVLLLGETGVGKGQAAAALGRSAYIPFDLKSRKFDASFLDVFISANISEYPETLVESELFGHKKGSFTGALENHSGLFGQTHPNGVLFLDEIGELDAPLQVKLLRVLQERVFSPVGSHEKKRFSGRLIAATNALLEEKVHAGSFRADLYHRLASDVIFIPSLRDRFAGAQEEKKILLSKIVERLLGHADALQEERIARILKRAVPVDYNWPGNLREFEQVVRRVILHGDALDLGHLGLERRESVQGNIEGVAGLRWEKLQWTADELMSRYARSAYDALGSYEKVAQKLQVDWRTVKRWVSFNK